MTPVEAVQQLLEEHADMQADLARLARLMGRLSHRDRLQFRNMDKHLTLHLLKLEDRYAQEAE